MFSETAEGAKTHTFFLIFVYYFQVFYIFFSFFLHDFFPE